MATRDSILAGVAGRYASALFDLATEERCLQEVETHLARFQSLLDESADLRRLVKSPVFSAEEQGRAMAAVLAKARITGLASKFLLLVARNRRLFVLPDMLEAFRRLIAEARGEVTAEVASAMRLSDAHVAALKDTLRASIGKEVHLSTKVDPSLLGGLVVKIGSRMFDSSLRTKLANLRVVLRGGS